MQKDFKSIFGDNHGLDSKSVEFLVNALEKNNLPGFDYLEFKQSLAALAKLDMDESTAFQSAFATAATMGLTKPKLLETAQHYQIILKKEQAQFEMAMKNQIAQKIDGKRQEVEKLKGQIAKHQEKIEQLQMQIAKFQTTIDGADAQISATQARIEGTRESFEHAHRSIMNQIQKDIDNINNYL